MEERKTIYGYINSREHGKQTREVTCPFCNETYEVYSWSFAGCGKRCSCGAKMGWIFTKSLPVVEDTESNEEQ